MKEIKQTSKNERPELQEFELVETEQDRLRGIRKVVAEVKAESIRKVVAEVKAESISKKKIKDPYTVKSIVKERLREEYKRYGKLVIAFDYDYTLNNYRKEKWTYPRVEGILKKWSYHATIICFTASEEERYVSIEKDMQQRGIEIDGVNTDAIQVKQGMGRKLYYNILLDDRAGLRECVEILEELYQEEIQTKQIRSYIEVHKGEEVIQEQLNEWVREVTQREMKEEIEERYELTKFVDRISTYKEKIQGREIAGHGEIRKIVIQDPKVIHDENRTRVCVTVSVGGQNVSMAKTINKQIK